MGTVISSGSINRDSKKIIEKPQEATNPGVMEKRKK